MNDDNDSLDIIESRYIDRRQANRELYIWILIIGVLFFIVISAISFAYLRNLFFAQETSFSLEIERVVPTLIPTADIQPLVDPEIVAALEVDVAEDDLPTATATPEPNPRPIIEPEIEIAWPPAGEILSLNAPYQIEATLSHPEGITNIQLLNNGQTVVSQSLLGQVEVDFVQQWVPLVDGRNTLSIVLIDGVGERTESELVDIRVIDQDFIDRNQAVFDKVNQEVARFRGLSLIDEIYPSVMGEGELRQFFRESGYTPEEARLDVLALSVFDFAPVSYDLYEASIQYAGGSIAGFYSPETKDFVLVSIDKEVDALEELVYSHELMHALQDQHFTLGALTNEDGSLDAEQQLALRALAEGEARLVEEFYLNSGQFSEEQRVELFNVFQRRYRPQQILIEPLPVLVNQFDFPYVAGREFVNAIWEAEGWEGVNRLWASPPQSTEQILHPERYLQQDFPSVVEIKSLEATLGGGWQLIRDDVFGEFYVREFLIQQLDEEVVDRAATGWGGDRYHVYNQNGADDVILVWRSTWDDGEENGQFASALQAYTEAAYGNQFVEAYPGAICRQGDVVVCTIQIAGDWLVVRAPTPDLARLALTTQFE